jgi:hypothetical protein
MERMQSDPALVNAIIASEVTVRHLYMRYRSLGGQKTRQELQSYLTGDVRWTTHDHDILADALEQEPDPAAG